MGGIGRAPGCGGGGPSALAVVVVAGLEAGVVRVGAGVSSSVVAVLGVVPSGFMGASLWMRIGGMVAGWQWLLWKSERLACRAWVSKIR